ncbi:MAG: hypothetical protein HGA19_04985, partial [Oscillochloris sp.]|nr:hypothetical protein [Oscillochloris sp.]
MTPSNHSNLYRRCASAAIASTAALEDRNEGTIFQELADALKIGVNAVRQRRDGRIDPAFTDLIARMGVRRGMLTYAWLENFLRAGKHPNREEILGELFPDEVGKPVPHLILQNLPAPSSPHFVMRLQQYSEIVRALYRYGIVVLVGAGGMGKSTIALQIARHCMMFEPPDARFQPPAFDAAVWVSDRDKPGRLDLAAVLDTIAKTLGSPHLAGRPMEIRQSQVDQLLRQQKILLIVDNVDTVNDLALLRWLLAVPEPSKALITTRTLTPVLLECASLIHVNAMGHEESQELFTHRAAEVQLGPVDSKLADALLAAAGGIPKALTMMLGQLRVGYPPDQILADAKNHRSDLLSALFERSWALLDKHAQQVLMALTAFIAPAEYQALAAVSDLRADELAITLKTLFALSLIDYEQRKPNVEQLIEPLRVTMHILARQYALARLGEVPVLAELFRERWLQWCVATVRERGGFTLNDIAQLTLLETCEPDLDEALAVAAKAQRHYDVIALARGLEFLYYVTAQWEKKLTLHRRYIDAARASRDVEEEIYALALHIQLLSRQGRPWLADEELRRLDNLAAPRQRDPATFFTLQHTCGLHALAAGRLSDALVHWQAVIARGSELGPDMVHAGHHWKGRVLQLQEQIV